MSNAGTWKKWEVNIVLGNLIACFREIGEDISSPRRKVKSIVKSQTNGAYPMAVSYLEMDCGHFVKAIFTYTAQTPYVWNREHVDANHIAQPGAELGCKCCRTYQENLAQLKALKPGDVQHSRFRTRDSRGFGKGDYYVYQRDPSSPTGVKLLMGIEATPEADEILRKLQASPLSPTEGR